MDVPGKAREVLTAAAQAAGRVLPGEHGGRAGAGPQTLTIERPAAEVLAACRDAAVLARLLGDLGTVEPDGPDLLRWTLRVGGGEHRVRTSLEPVPGTDGEGGVRFVGADGGGGEVAVLITRPAPQDHGTEVRLRVDPGPVPAAVAGAAAFTVLYRLRALLQTGEVPTLGRQPSARPSPR